MSAGFDHYPLPSTTPEQIREAARLRREDDDDLLRKRQIELIGRVQAENVTLREDNQRLEDLVMWLRGIIEAKGVVET